MAVEMKAQRPRVTAFFAQRPTEAAQKAAGTQAARFYCNEQREMPPKTCKTALLKLWHFKISGWENLPRAKPADFVSLTPMISKATIDKVYDTARVEEVIGDYVQLKRAGSNFKGLSPFSNERSPSFMVSPVKQIWKDFSSGKGGNVVAFLMEHEHFTYPEAIRYLAKRYNIEIEETVETEEEKASADVRESLYLVSEYAKKYFETQLHETEQGKAIGLTYFKERGFTTETIKKFALGYHPDGYSTFSEAAKKAGYNPDFLVGTGLSIARDNGELIDRFRGRVMFPILSMSGRTLGFGGRILTNDKKAAKYLNSPESEIYYKSKVLYGIFYAKQAIAKQDLCYLVEGYTDVIQMHQAGIENVVSSSGTALTSEQIRLINRLTKNITVLFDGDAAGLRAALRGIDLILEEGMNVRVCSFPDGEDPDSFARKNSKEDIEAYFAANAKDFIRFKASLLMAEAKNDPIKKADLIRDIVQSISKIPDRIQREIYVQECAQIMEISEQVLVSTLAQMLQKDLKESFKKQQNQNQPLEVVKAENTSTSDKINVLETLEKKIIELLLLYGTSEATFEDYVLETTENGEVVEKQIFTQAKVYERIFLSLQQDEIIFSNETFRGIYELLIAYLTTHDKFSAEQFMSDLPVEYAPLVAAILMEEEKIQLHNWESRDVFVKSKQVGIAQYVNETILSLRWYLVDRIIADLMTQISPDPTVDNSEILSNTIDYQQLIKSFSDKLGRVLSRF